MSEEKRSPELHLMMSRIPESVPCIAMTLAEAAQACGVSTSTLRKFIDDGSLKAKRTTEATGVILVSPDALRSWYDRLPDA